MRTTNTYIKLYIEDSNVLSGTNLTNEEQNAHCKMASELSMKIGGKVEVHVDMSDSGTWLLATYNNGDLVFIDHMES